ncbi:MAG: tRNA (guanosine(46)-N7)-methyltransferase TrmB [Epulopiscium sp. Nuni2H_MBin003]|nr:MAG: tRNA (guanosine(46)-N7)-methyltransferase TrmB [Epulopiscium sp. Nuni2H_MBin003]
MRLRHDKNASEYLANSTHIIKNPTDFKGQWHKLFGNNNPIHVEFGCGKGAFITTLATQYPDINYLAIERAETVVYKAIKNATEIPANLYFLYFDGADCLDIFNDSEIARIYLNFSDPWHKNRYKKRRLTYRDFLSKYEQILDTTGELHFKTDNKNLFAFSIEEFSNQKWLIKNVSLDLHNENIANVMTEYEQKFSTQGVTINRLEAIPPKKYFHTP